MRKAKRFLSLILILIMCFSVMPMTELGIETSAASNIIINGVDIGYANGDYFTKDGKSCATDDFANGRCHKNGICTNATDSRCNCMRYWPSYPNYKIDLKASQCFGFARYCQWKIYGYHDGSSSSKFSDLTGTVSSSNCTASNLKSKLNGCAPATHIRTGDGEHSIVIVKANDNGVSVADCNSNGYCIIKTYSYTWASFATYLKGRSGISYSKSAKDATVKPSVISKPTISSAKGDNNSEITIKWIKVDTATKYKVERRKSGTDDYVVAIGSTTSTSFTDTGLEKGQRYFYRVTAYNGSTKLGTSDSVGVYTKFSPPIVTAVSNSKLKLTWDSVSKAESYTVMRRQSGGAAYEAIKTVTTTSFEDSGLSASTKYYYWIQANCDVDGIKIIAKSTTGGQYTLTKSPEITEIDDTSKSEITIIWNAVDGATSYRIERRQSGTEGYSTIVDSITSTTYVDSGLETGKRYYYRVYAKNQGGESYSPIVGVYTKFNAPSVQIVNGSQLKLTWNSISMAESYTIKRRAYNETSYTDINTVTTTSYTDTGLSSGTRYYYWIQANCNIDGTKMVAKSTTGSNITQITIPTLSVASSSSIKVNWKTVNDNTSYKYNVQRKMLGESSYKTIATVTTNSYTDTGLNSSTTYYYRVQVVDSNNSVKTISSEADAKTSNCTHNTTEVRNAKSATCTATGYTGDTYCKTCGTKTKTGSTIAKKAHNSNSTIPAVSATCKSTGLTEGKKCSVCGIVTVAQQTVAKKSHVDNNGDYKCDYGCGYAFEKPADPTPDTPEDTKKDCSCNCHKGGISGFFFKIINFFQKLFGMNKVCACGVKH